MDKECGSDHIPVVSLVEHHGFFQETFEERVRLRKKFLAYEKANEGGEDDNDLMGGLDLDEGEEGDGDSNTGGLSLSA